MTDHEQALAGNSGGGVTSSFIEGKKGSRRSRDLGATHSKYVAGADGTFSQNYQDVWVAAFAKHNGWEKGFFLDLGAYHGTECSNSALLEKTLGWSGICVEPEPVGFEDRSCALVSRALSNVSDTPIKFYGHGQIKHIGFRPWEDSPDDEGVDVNTITVAEMFDCLQGQATNAANCNRIAGAAKIPNFIHFVSLDVEGQEANVLTGFPWDKYQVGAWVVEQTTDQSRPPDAQERTRDILRAHGYMKAPVESPGVDEYWLLPKFWSDDLKTKAWRIHPDGSNGC
jgi:hypothetical protein